MAGTALLAGGGAVTSIRLGLSMTALQFAIGALNDLVDAPADHLHVPPKPIPAGIVTIQEARSVAVGAAAIGLVAAAPSGLATVGLAFVVLAIGAAYDLVAKGTPWSWLPFAVGIPILPVYGWFGATGTLPGFFGVLVPMAVLAGAGLAVANARVDLETDRAAGTRSVATALGSMRAWLVDAALMTAATAIGVLSGDRAGSTMAEWIAVIVGTSVVAVGLALGILDRRSGRASWQLQAIGAGIAGLGWIAALVSRV